MVDAGADVGAAQRLLNCVAAGDPLPEPLAVDSLTVEDAQQHDLLDAVPAHPPGAKRLPQGVLSQFLEQEVIPEFFWDVHGCLLSARATAAGGVLLGRRGRSSLFHLDTPPPAPCQ